MWGGRSEKIYILFSYFDSSIFAECGWDKAACN